MPVTKFRHPDDARRALLMSDVPVAKRMRDVYATWRTRWPLVHPRGIQRFGSMDAAQASLDALRRRNPRVKEPLA